LKRYEDDGDDKDSFDESKRKLAMVEQMSMLVNSILSVRDQAVVIMLAKTGLRRIELASIDAEDENGGTGNINWRIKYNAKEKEVQKEKRQDNLFRRRNGQSVEKVGAPRKKLYPKIKALFVNEYGERLRKSGIYNLVTKYAEAVGLHNPSIRQD
jgi:integrase/recombinase XerD